jgi:hypothetical protein
MTTRWYVTPYDPALWRDEETTVPRPSSDLTISFSHFLDTVWYQWPELQAAFPHSWQLPINGLPGLSGSFFGKGNQILAIEPDVGFVEFLLWYRAFVPSKYDLFLFSEGDWDSLLLTPSSTADEIDAFTRFDL